MTLKNSLFAIFSSFKEAGIYKYPSMLAEIKKLSASDQDLFPILWAEAISRQDFDKYVFQSAYSLYKLNLECQISLHDALRQLYEDWDISIEEVVWYLANQFSDAAIRLTISELKQQAELKDKEVISETILYWLDCKR